MHSPSSLQPSDGGDLTYSPTFSSPPTPSSPTSPTYSPTSPSYSPTSPQLNPSWNARRSSSAYNLRSESGYEIVERAFLHSRGTARYSPNNHHPVYTNTYQTWDNGESMRYEDENLLAACSEPFVPSEGRQTQTSTLLKLPAELQNEILLNVDRSAFKALSQTCIPLRAAVMPLILERIILSGNSPRLYSVVETIETTISTSRETANMIRHLQLPDDDTISKILSRLLPLTPKLKSLDYGYIIQEDKWGGVDEIDARGFSRLLEPVQNTLTSLKFTYVLDLNEYDAGGSPCVEGWLCLKAMVALRTLETTFTILFGPSPREAPSLGDILPSGLVELRIRSDPWEYDPAMYCIEERIEAVAGYVRDRNWKRYTPNLRLLNSAMDSWRDLNIPSRAERIAPAEKALAELMRENGLEWAVEAPLTRPETNLYYRAVER